MDSKKIFTFIAENKQIIAAVLAGTLAIIAAYIRRDKRLEQRSAKKPVIRLTAIPIFYLLVGFGCLGAEFFAFNVKDPKTPDFNDPGSFLVLVGCVFVAAGAVWLPINLSRLVLWPTPKDLPTSSTVVKSSSVLAPKPPASVKQAPPGK
jgi:hypothetical protein